VDAHVQLLPDIKRSLAPRTAIRFHAGTADVPGHLVLPDLNPLKPGTESYVQVQLSAPVVVAPGDFFVIRLLSPVLTLGGGTVIAPDTTRMRRSKGNWETAAQEKEAAFKDPATAVRHALEHPPGVPRALADIARDAFVSADATQRHLDALVDAGHALALSGSRYAPTHCLDTAKQSACDELARLHDDEPMAMGFDKKTLFRSLHDDRDLLNRAMEQLLADATIEQNRSGYYLPGHLPSLSEQQTALASRIEELYQDTRFESPRLDELAVTVGAPDPILRPIVTYLRETGVLVSLSDKVTLHKDVLEESKQALISYLETHDELQSSAFKDQLGCTRKYAIPILEYWDAQGLTLRKGNVRILRRR
jgi:selenocysteine-specific elongation factor